MTPNPNPDKLVQIQTIAPMPYMVKGAVAESFGRLKASILKMSGQDFLARCADVMRPKGFTSKKPGVALHSNHMTGRAFDFDQTPSYLHVQSDPKAGKQYFITWIECKVQDGTQGVLTTVHDIRGHTVKVFCINFTDLAASYGWSRIPAQDGWTVTGKNYSKMEFWHYEQMNGLNWQQAMDYIYGGSPLDILQLGSIGAEVKEFQLKLFRLGYLESATDADGKFGPKTDAAVRKFQKENGLPSDGKLGFFTKGKINQRIEERKIMAFDYDTNEVNSKVAAEADENMTPKPWYQTSQFGVLLVTLILGPFAMWLVSKGLITPDQAPIVTGFLQVAIVGAIAYVANQYVKGRNEISAIKARAAAVRSLSVSGPEALAAFKALDRN